MESGAVSRAISKSALTAVAAGGAESESDAQLDYFLRLQVELEPALGAAIEDREISRRGHTSVPHYTWFQWLIRPFTCCVDADDTHPLPHRATTTTRGV